MSMLGQLKTCLNLMTTRQNSCLSPPKEISISITYLLPLLLAMLTCSRYLVVPHNQGAVCLICHNTNAVMMTIQTTHYLVHTAHKALLQFSVPTSSCSLLVPRLSRPTDWSKVFVDCIHVIFRRPLGVATGLNEICNACLAGVPSRSPKMCPVNLSLF